MQSKAMAMAIRPMNSEGMARRGGGDDVVRSHSLEAQPMSSVNSSLTVTESTSSVRSLQHRKWPSGLHGVCSKCDRIAQVYCQGCHAHFCARHDKRKHRFKLRNHPRSGALHRHSHRVSYFSLPREKIATTKKKKKSSSLKAEGSFPTEDSPSASSTGSHASSKASRKEARAAKARKGAISQIQNGYDSLVSAIVRPPRCLYSQCDLGPEALAIGAGLSMQRLDFEVVNRRGLTLKGSQWRPSFVNETMRLPCVVYLHGNSSARVDVVRTRSLNILGKMGCTVVAFDFAGSGRSDGEHVTLGCFEHHDVGDVLTFLKREEMAAKFILWGRSMGAASALLFAAQYKSGDFALQGLVLDSPFASFRLLAMDLVKAGQVNVPSVALKAALALIRRSVRKRTGADIKRLDPISGVSSISCPGLFIAAKGDKMIPPSHGEMLVEAYKGPKYLIRCEGGHNSVRTTAVRDGIATFVRACFRWPDTQMIDAFATITRRLAEEEVMPPRKKTMMSAVMSVRQSGSSAQFKTKEVMAMKVEIGNSKEAGGGGGGGGAGGAAAAGGSGSGVLESLDKATVSELMMSGSIMISNGGGGGGVGGGGRNASYLSSSKYCQPPLKPLEYRPAAPAVMVMTSTTTNTGTVTVNKGVAAGAGGGRSNSNGLRSFDKSTVLQGLSSSTTNSYTGGSSMGRSDTINVAVMSGAVLTKENCIATATAMDKRAGRLVRSWGSYYEERGEKEEEEHEVTSILETAATTTKACVTSISLTSCEAEAQAKEKERSRLPSLASLGDVKELQATDVMQNRRSIDRAVAAASAAAGSGGGRNSNMGSARMRHRVSQPQRHQSTKALTHSASLRTQRSKHGRSLSLSPQRSRMYDDDVLLEQMTIRASLRRDYDVSSACSRSGDSCSEDDDDDDDDSDCSDDDDDECESGCTEDDIDSSSNCSEDDVERIEEGEEEQSEEQEMTTGQHQLRGKQQPLRGRGRCTYDGDHDNDECDTQPVVSCHRLTEEYQLELSPLSGTSTTDLYRPSGDSPASSPVYVEKIHLTG